MCKKCKYCGESNLGVVISQINSVSARMLDGKVVEFFKESEEESESQVVNYCFTCAKEITEKDLVETIKCSSCGKEVLSVDKDGLCQECSEAKHEAEEEAEKIKNMSQEELVAMIMAQRLGKKQPAEDKTLEDLEKVDAVVIETDKDQDIEVGNNLKNDEVEDSNETEKPKKTRQSKPKQNPAPVEESKVEEAHEAAIESVKTAESSQAADVAKVTKNNDQEIKVDTDATIPVKDVSEEDSILKALEEVDLDMNADNFGDTPATDGFPF